MVDKKYIPITLLNQAFFDKDTGLALAAGTLEFFRDNSRATLKDIFEIVNTGGAYVYAQLTNPVTLSATGTVLNAAGDNVAIYLYPFTQNPTTKNLDEDRYYIVCKSSAGTTQWVREAVPNNITADGPEGVFDASNELSNPQFSRYFLHLDEQFTSTSNNETLYPIAPDWNLSLKGIGSVTLKRVAVSGSQNIVTSPSHYLDVTTGNGITSCSIKQRLKKSSGIWSSKSLSGLFAAQLIGGSNNNISMHYRDSSGVLSDITIFDAMIDSSFRLLTGGITLGASTNAFSGDDSYVDIEIKLPIDTNCRITSIQLVPSEADDTIGVTNYDYRSANREQAFMGDWYLPRVEQKEIESILVGWDFTLNPRQFSVEGVVPNSSAEYTWDQTILQTNNVGSVEYGLADSSRCIYFNSTASDGGYAIIQYLDGDLVNKLNQTRLSVNVSAYTQNAGSNSGMSVIKVRLFANAVDDTENFGVLPSTIFDIDLNGDVTLSPQATLDGWYEIPRSNLPTARAQLKRIEDTGFESLTTFENDYGFNGWEIDDALKIIDGVSGFAIAVSVKPEDGKIDYRTIFNSISLVPGDIPTRPAYKGYQDTLDECGRFYEKSYPIYNLPGHAGGIQDETMLTQLTLKTTVANIDVYPESFGTRFRNEKRILPINTLYSPSSGFINKILITVWTGQINRDSLDFDFPDITFWQEPNFTSTVGFTYFPRTSAPMTTVASAGRSQVYIHYHYVSDARIGVV